MHEGSLAALGDDWALDRVVVDEDGVTVLWRCWILVEAFDALYLFDPFEPTETEYHG